MDLTLVEKSLEASRKEAASKAAAGRGHALSGDVTCDVVIVGCGVAGLYAALNLPRALHVIMLCKGAADECDSMLAQGGICVMRDHDDYDSWYGDTMRAGHYENRPASVDQMIWSSRTVINDLIRLGVHFDRDETGELDYTREGGHSRRRIIHRADMTGAEITTTLLERAMALPNVEIHEQTCMVDIIAKDGSCAGVVARGAAGEARIHAHDTLLATGGIGGLYDHSTNFRLLTGDGCRVCEEHGVELEHMDYVQFHPTTLYSTKPGRSFLISESCRGEGAKLIGANGKRFCDELQPRDVVTAAIRKQMALEGTDHVRLSFADVPREVVLGHFSNIYKTCLEHGYDILKEPLPVVPGQHYLMGGIHVDQNSRTTMEHLYAAGETSCNGVHGANRLASNSLLESMVFSRLAAHDIVRRRHQ
jgi:L-aspartate oxidase